MPPTKAEVQAARQQISRLEKQLEETPTYEDEIESPLAAKRDMAVELTDDSDIE